MLSNSKRPFMVVAITLVIAGTAIPVRMWGAQKSDKGYIKHTFNARAVALAAAAAGINQGTDTPHEWGQGLAGFGRRFASSFGKHVIQRSIQYPVARLFHEEISYRRSGKTGFGPRLEYALIAVVITHKTTTGNRTPNVGEVSGAIGGGLISRLWQPASTGTIAEGFESAGISLGVNAGLNVVREFWPEIRHPHRHSSTAAALVSLPVTATTHASVFNPELEPEERQPIETEAEVIVVDANPAGAGSEP